MLSYHSIVKRDKWLKKPCFNRKENFKDNFSQHYFNKDESECFINYSYDLKNNFFIRLHEQEKFNNLIIIYVHKKNIKIKDIKWYSGIDYFNDIEYFSNEPEYLIDKNLEIFCPFINVWVFRNIIEEDLIFKEKLEILLEPLSLKNYHSYTDKNQFYLRFLCWFLNRQKFIPYELVELIINII